MGAEGAGRDHDEEAFGEEEHEEESDGGVGVTRREVGGRDMFRCWSLELEDEEEEDEEVEVDEEGETSDDHHPGSLVTFPYLPFLLSFARALASKRV